MGSRFLFPFSLSAVLLGAIGCGPAEPPGSPGPPEARFGDSEDLDRWLLAAEGDPELARALRDAVGLEEQPGVAPSRNLEAWRRVAELAGDKKVGSAAAERVELWKVAVRHEASRSEMLRRLKERYEQDARKTLPLGESTRAEFCEVYRSRAADLDAVGVEPPYAAMCP
jgi:hypothetical protein